MIDLGSGPTSRIDTVCTAQVVDFLRYTISILRDPFLMATCLAFRDTKCSSEKCNVAAM